MLTLVSLLLSNNNMISYRERAAKYTNMCYCNVFEFKRGLLKICVFIVLPLALAVLGESSLVHS